MNYNLPKAIEISVGEKKLKISFNQIIPGSFMMGSNVKCADFDEVPVHKVTITKPFYMAQTQITNDVYEQFCAEHKNVRGKLGYNNMFNSSLGKDGFKGYSFENTEAAVFVSYNEATAFCDWLNENYLTDELKNEGYIFRLPTEAEWEYSCRAGTDTEFNTGKKFPKSQFNNQDHKNAFYPDPSRNQKNLSEPLTVAKFPPNKFGLYDMHGNVEEWVLDWYGSYDSKDQTDPKGRENGLFRVTRGGSHSTSPEYLRSAARSGALPEDRNFMIGFRVAIGCKTDDFSVLPEEEKQPYQKNVSQTPFKKEHIDNNKSFFKGPLDFVFTEPSSKGPFYWHNHQPAVCECPNGDLLAAWFTGEWENSRKLNYAVSRKRYGSDKWEKASLFFDTPDRNNTGCALLCDGETIFHILGQSYAACYGALMLMIRKSTDNGVTWTKPEIIGPEYQLRHQVIASPFIAENGDYVFTCDASSESTGGSALWISKDKGVTWTDNGAADYKDNPGKIRGIHASAVDLKDENGKTYYMAYGRNEDIDGKMPQSISYDEGKTWEYKAGALPTIGDCKRLVMKKLESGALFVAAFTGKKGMVMPNANGKIKKCHGLYAALSYDNGKTYPYMRLISDQFKGIKRLNGKGNTGKFFYTASRAEHSGYLTAVQSHDGVIHLLSSAFEYQFNEKWIKDGFEK